MLHSRTAGALVLLVALSAVAVPARSAAPSETRADWPDRRVMHIAHQGGENQAPSSTIYAFDRGLRQGADMLELDIHGTADEKVLVLHDAKVDRTTNGSGFVSDMTARQVQRLDAAHNFVPGRNAVRGLPARSYPFRGIRTGKTRPPKRYRPRDFRVPRLHEVLKRYPDVAINIEIKGNSDDDQGSFNRNARLLAGVLNRYPERAGDVIVVSFNQAAVDRFHDLAPAFGTAPGIIGVTGFFTAGLDPGNNTVALQVPISLAGVEVANRSFIARAHARGFAVHVFTSGDDEETPGTYRELVDRCVDGIMTSYPTRLERFLEKERIVRPDRPGLDPCSG